MKKQMGFLLTSLLAFSSISLANPWQSMTKAEVEHAFVNKTWTTVGLTRINDKTMPGNTFTGHWDNKGYFYGKFSEPLKKGPQKDEGTYQVKANGEVCLKFSNWNEGKEFCDYIYQTKDAYVAVGVEDLLHTVILKEDVKSGNQMNK